MAEEFAGKMKATEESAGDDPVTITIAPGDAAIVFTPDGLHAMLPVGISLESLMQGKNNELPWHVWAAAVALEAMDEALTDTWDNADGALVEEMCRAGNLLANMALFQAATKDPGVA